MSRLLDTKHDPTEVLEVLDSLAKDDRSYYDDKTRTRKVPHFAYNPETGQPSHITFWSERKVIPNDGSMPLTVVLERCRTEGKDTYIEGRGWILNGKKPERDFDHGRNF